MQNCTYSLRFLKGGLCMYLCMSAGIVFHCFVLCGYEGAYRLFLTRCAELQDVIESLQVKVLYKHMSDYQTLHRYEHLSI